MKIVGVDPGLTGGLALMVGSKLEEAIPMPVLSKKVQGNLVADVLRL